jgi:hypothetical protein
VTPVVALVVVVLAGIMAASFVRQTRARTWSVRRHRRALDTLRRIAAQRPDRPAAPPAATERDIQAHVRILSPGSATPPLRGPGETPPGERDRSVSAPGPPLAGGRPRADPDSSPPTGARPVDLRLVGPPSAENLDAPALAGDPLGPDPFDDDGLDSRLLDAVFGARVPGHEQRRPDADPDEGGHEGDHDNDSVSRRASPPDPLSRALEPATHVHPAAQDTGVAGAAAPQPRHSARRPALTVATAVIVLGALGAALGQALVTAGRHPARVHTAAQPAVGRPARAAGAALRPVVRSTPRPAPPVTLISSVPGTSLYRLAVAATPITFEANGLCWVEIRRSNAEGPVIYSAAMTAGVTESVHGPIWVRLGNPTAVAIRVGGTAVSPTVEPGQPYDLEFE